LLGVPGLINAYKTTATLALQVTRQVQKPILIPYSLQFDYTRMNDVMRSIRQFDCQVYRQESQLFCQLEIGVPQSRQEEFKFMMKEMKGVELLNR
jgi:putative IMPACT (imprinted ancient) family translation regulator